MKKIFEPSNLSAEKTKTSTFSPMSKSAIENYARMYQYLKYFYLGVDALKRFFSYIANNPAARKIFETLALAFVMRRAKAQNRIPDLEALSPPIQITNRGIQQGKKSWSKKVLIAILVGALVAVVGKKINLRDKVDEHVEALLQHLPTEQIVNIYQSLVEKVLQWYQTTKDRSSDAYKWLSHFLTSTKLKSKTQKAQTPVRSLRSPRTPRKSIARRSKPSRIKTPKAVTSVRTPRNPIASKSKSLSPRIARTPHMKNPWHITPITLKSLNLKKLTPSPTSRLSSKTVVSSPSSSSRSPIRTPKKTPVKVTPIKRSPKNDTDGIDTLDL